MAAAPPSGTAPINYKRYIDSDVFGTDGIPNVYIEKVYVTDGNSEDNTPVSLQVQLSVYEISTGAQDSLWYTNETARKYFKMNVGYIVGLTETPDRGEETLSFDAGDLDSYAYDTISDPAGIIYKIPYEITLKLDNVYSISDWGRIDVTANFYLDVEQMVIDYSVSATEIPSSSPLVSTISVVKNGKISTKRTQYYTATDHEWWLGATHQRAGSVMAGVKHSTTVEHPTLIGVQVTNPVFLAAGATVETVATIIDFSQSNSLQDLMQVGEQTIRAGYINISEEAYITNEFITLSNNSKMCSFFSIDFLKMMLFNSEFGYIYSRLSDSIREEIISKVEIIDLRIIRQRTDIENGRLEDLMSTENMSKTSLTSHNLGSSGHPTFQFMDYIAGTGIGIYTHKLKLTIRDPIYDFLSDFYNDLSDVIVDLTYYYHEASRQTNYNYTLDTLKNDYIDELNSRFNGTEPYWTKAQNVLLEFFSAFDFDISIGDLFTLASNVGTYLTPETANLGGILEMMEVFEVIKSNFQSLTNTADFDALNESSPNSSSDHPKNIIYIDHDFEPFDVSDYTSYLEFLKIPRNDGKISLAKFQGNWSDDVFQYISPTMAGFAIAIDDATYSFFSLNSVNLNGSSYDTSTWDIDVYKELMALYNLEDENDRRSMESGYTGYEAAQLMNNSGISIDFGSLALIPSEALMSTPGAGAFRGPGTGQQPIRYMSSLNTQESETFLNLSTLIPFDDHNAGAEVYNQAVIRAINGIDPDSDYWATQSETIIKAIGGTTSGFAVGSLGELVSGAGYTGLNIQIAKFVLYLKYGTMGRIEYLSDPSYSSDGGVSDPQWERLTSDIISNNSGNLLCKIRRILPQISSTGGYPDKSQYVFDHNIINSYFILEL